MMLLLCVACGLGISSALEATYYDSDQAEQLFEDFIKTYNKIYSDTEKQMRFEIFKKTLHTLNNKNSFGHAVFAIDKFSDLTEKEFVHNMGFSKPSGNGGDSCEVVTDNDINTNLATESKNWVELGAVTAVKNQNGCGSSWAFATTGIIESQHFLHLEHLESLSEQELVDCSKSNNGCDGGHITGAMTDVKNLGGIQTEASYPYKSKKQSCQFDKNKAVTTITGCKYYQLQDESKLKEVLALRGPVAIVVNGFGMQGYTKGIISREICDAETLNHAALLVGYGTEDSDDYWLIKNSWGTDWGEKGYVRISRGENTCGLMNPYTVGVDVSK